MTINILNIAHRGARAYAPENTLPAFTKAKALGCGMFEMDVRLSKDGVIIVHHDENLTRCTDIHARFPSRCNENVWDFTFAELSTLDAGSWYLRQLELPNEQRQTFLQSLTDAEINDHISHADKTLYASGTIKIPTLKETLALARKLSLMVNIELKSPCQDSQALIAGVLAIIEAEQMESEIIISSFDHSYLKAVKKLSKTIPIAVLTDPLMSAPITFLRKLQANTFNLGCYWEFPTQSFDSVAGRNYLKNITKLRKHAVNVNIWTCNNPTEMQYLLAMGITGIISDYPNRVTQATTSFLNNQSSIRTI